MELKGRVVLITGGSNGIGLCCAKELLHRGAKVSICDIDTEVGEQVTKGLRQKYGEKNLLFSQCDVTDYLQFEEAFQMTMKYFGGLDIVINNAAVMNDRFWELEVDVNLNGVIRGTLLAHQYMGKNRGGKGGIIVNISGTSFRTPQTATPIYTATQCAIVGLSKSFGDSYHVGLTGIKTICVCPSYTETGLLQDIPKKLMSSEFMPAWERDIKNSEKQTPNTVALGVIDVLAKANSGSVWIIENRQPPREHR